MKTLFRVFTVAVVAAVFHFLILGVLMFAGVGPFGRSLSLVASGAMSSYNESTSRAWFQAAEQSVMLDRFVLWPGIFLLASILSARFVPKARWWHSIVIACAVLPLSVPVAAEAPRLPGSSVLSPWIGLLTELLAYTLLIGLLSYLVRRFPALHAPRNAAV